MAVALRSLASALIKRCADMTLSPPNRHSPVEFDFARDAIRQHRSFTEPENGSRSFTPTVSKSLPHPEYCAVRLTAPPSPETTSAGRLCRTGQAGTHPGTHRTRRSQLPGSEVPALKANAYWPNGGRIVGTPMASSPANKLGLG